MAGFRPNMDRNATMRTLAMEMGVENNVSWKEDGRAEAAMLTLQTPARG